MLLNDVVGVNCKKKAQLLKIEAQVSGIWTMGCMLDGYVCVICLDMSHML